MWNQTTYYSPLINDLYYVEVSWVFTLLQLGIVIIARYLSIYYILLQLQQLYLAQQCHSLLIYRFKKQLDEEESKLISEVPTLVLIDQKKKKELSEAQKIIKYMDQHYFKRWFIYDYENRKDRITQEKKQIKTETLQEIYEKAFSETSEEDSVKQRNEDFIQLPNFEDKSPTSPLAVKLQELSQQI